MRIIWKFLITPTKGQWSFDMPKGAKILSVQWQENMIALWVLIVNHDAPRIMRYISVDYTGEELIHYGKFIGTLQASFGLVLHIFDLGEKEA